MHDVPLGQPLTNAELVEFISQHGKDQTVLTILQMIRNKACMMDRAGRQVPAGADPGDYRAYHGGAADALEEFFWDIYGASQTELDKELEEPE